MNDSFFQKEMRKALWDYSQRHTGPIGRAPGLWGSSVRYVPWLLAGLLSLVILSGCSTAFSEPAGVSATSGKLRLLATTTIIADVVEQVGGEAVQVQALLPPGADPHTFEPAPQDAAAAADARLIFINGAGLEPFLGRMGLDPADERLVDLSQGLTLLKFEPGSVEASRAGEADPHVWFDPQNVIRWTESIARSLGQIDPANTQTYNQNAVAYQVQLGALEDWIVEQVAQVPPENRKLVTDHLVFGYFAGRFGFEQVGAVVPGLSTATQPSAQELAALEERILAQGVPAIFVGATANPNLAQRVAEDTGVRLVTLPTESGNYLELMRSAVGTLVEALK